MNARVLTPQRASAEWGGGLDGLLSAKVDATFSSQKTHSEQGFSALDYRYQTEDLLERSSVQG